MSTDPQSSMMTPDFSESMTRRSFLAASAIASAALIIDPKLAFATYPDGLPQYWNGWNCLTDDYTDPSNSTLYYRQPPAVISRNTTDLDLFAFGNDNRVWFKTWTQGTYSSAWTAWEPIMGMSFSVDAPIVAVALDATHMNVFAIGTDHNIYTNAWTNSGSGGSWAGWTQITTTGNVSSAVPFSVVSRSATQMDLFALGTNGYVYTTSWSGSSWTTFTQVASGGSFNTATGVALCSPDSDHMDIFVIGSGGIWTNSWYLGSWFGWYLISGTSNASTQVTPSVVSRGPLLLDIVTLGTDGYVWAIEWSGSWGTFTQLSGEGPFNPTRVALCNPDSTHMNIFALGTDTRIWSQSWNSTSGWLGWYVLSDNPSSATLDNFATYAPPAVVARDSGHLDVVCFQSDQRIYRDTFGQTPLAVYVPLTTSRICQLTSDYDPAGLPHINNTVTPWGIVGTDMGAPLEFGGNLYLLYGDVPSSSGDPNPDNADPMLYTTNTTVGANGIALNCVTQSSGAFLPFEIAGYGYLPGNDTPIGAFSYNNMAYVYTYRDDGSGPYTTLTGSTSMSTPFTDYYDISNYQAGVNLKFLQIAPWVIQNANVPGLPSTTGDGLLFWGWGYSGIVLGWCPLTPGVNPPPQSSIQYYAGGGTWTSIQADAVPVVDFLNVTALNVTYLSGPGLWLMTYTRASESLPHESIVARVGISPFVWSDEIVLFNPDRENAWTHWMHLPGSGDGLNNGPWSWPDSVQGYAYAPFVLNRFTQWNASTRIARVYYTISTFDPYQVQLMSSQIQFE